MAKKLTAKAIARQLGHKEPKVVREPLTKRDDKRRDYERASELAANGFNNNVDEWAELAELVRRMGNMAPKEAKEASIKHTMRMAQLPSPFAGPTTPVYGKRR
jgi:hypothetical protein